MVPEGSAVPSLGTKVENSPQTVLKPPRRTSYASPAEAVGAYALTLAGGKSHLARLARGGRAKGLSGQPS